MNETLYIIGEKVAGKYPSGRYVATKLSGRVHDHYIVSAVLDYPPVRAVGNPEAWSNAKVYKYGKMFSFLRRDMVRQPEVYDGVIDDTEEGYKRSLVDAIRRARTEAIKEGDMEAAKLLILREAELREAV